MNPLVHAFEAATLDPTTFHHREHLLVAWHYLRELPLEDALARYVRHLRALTAKLGVPQKFHATVTWSYLVLLSQAMERTPGATFDALLAATPALLERPGTAFAAWYAPEQLDSPEARKAFVLPRRA